MKKKVAVFANLWSADILDMFFEGIFRSIPENSIDFYLFLSSNSYGRQESINKCEETIHDLPIIEDYDIAIIFPQGLNSEELKEKIYEKCDKANIPVIVIGDKYEGFHSVTANNKPGMRALCEHMYDVHNARKMFYVAGGKKNADSIARLEVIKEFTKEKNLEFTEDDIFYSEWELIPTVEFVKNKFTNPETNPDVIICANDFLAMSVCTGLDDGDFRCPKDIAVTGYDNVRSNKIYYPSITTVDQQYDKAGEKTAEIISHIIDRSKEIYSYQVDSRCVTGESCGCKSEIHENNRNVYCHTQLSTDYDSNHRKARLFSTAHEIYKAERFSDMIERLRKLYYDEDGAEGSFFQIMLSPDFENLSFKTVEDMPVYSIPEQFKVIVSKCGDCRTKKEEIDRRDLIPSYDGRGENRVFIFMPLYYKTFSCGYLTMSGPTSGFGKEWKYNEYSESIIEALKNCISNIQLTALNDKLSTMMNTDPMTRVRNRVAFENYKEMLRVEFGKGTTTEFAVALFDINNLKYINDHFGHNHGDTYIKNCCQLICKTFTHSPVFRIGGDEFVAIFRKGADYDNLDELFDLFQYKMDASSTQTEWTNRLSIASGVAYSSEVKSDKFDELFKIADERMYDRKKEMKKSIA